MWSAIPFTLLYMIMNLSKGSRVAAPKGTKSSNTGRLSCVPLSIYPFGCDLRHERPNLRLEWSDLKPERPYSKPERPYLRPWVAHIGMRGLI